MSWEHIDLAIDGAGAIATIALNRPDALNAFSGSMREDLLAAINEAAAGARVLIITGAGKGFCSGGDVRFMAELRRESRSEALAPLIEQGKRVVQRLRDLPIPSVACVNGVAAGAGFGLALACDLRIASATARFAASFSRLGLHPDWGTSFFLTRLAGAAVARELIFTGRLIDAAEALRLGLVNRVVEPGRRTGGARERQPGARGGARRRGASFHPICQQSGSTRRSRISRRGSRLRGRGSARLLSIGRRPRGHPGLRGEEASAIQEEHGNAS